MRFLRSIRLFNRERRTARPPFPLLSLLEVLEDRSVPANLIGHGFDPTLIGDDAEVANWTFDDTTVATVFGSDDRIPVNDTTIAPFRSIVQLRMTFPGSSEEWIGTGAIVGAYHVLTAGHNLYDPELGGWATSIQVIAARNDQYLPFGVANAVYKRTFDAFINTGDQKYDMGLLTLDRNIGNHTGVLAVDSWTNAQLNTTVNLAGYPVEFARGNKMYRASGSLASTDADMLYYNGTMDTSGGMSGSPIWATNPSTGVRTVVGVHVAGAPQGGNTNAGVRITADKWSTFTAAMAADNATRAPTDLPDLIDYDFWFGTTTSYTSSNSVNAGANFSITARLFNLGTAASAGYTVRFYASYDRVIDATDMFIGSTTTGALAPFTAIDVTWSGQFPQLAPGQAYIGWIIDPQNAVAEFSTANNTGMIEGGRIAFNQIGDVSDHIAAALDTGVNPVYGTFNISRFIGDGAYTTRDVDMYKFYGAAGVRLSAITAMPNGGANLDGYLRLFSANGAQLAFDDDSAGGTYPRIDYTLPATGVYYLGVSSSTNRNYDPSVPGSGVVGEVGNYMLSISLVDASTVDVGDTIATALNTGLSTAGGTFTTIQRIGNGAATNRDVDMYRFTVVAGATVTAITKLPPSGIHVDTYFRLFNSAGTVLATDDDSANELHYSYLQYTFANAGTYYLGVSGYANISYNPNTGGNAAVGDTGEYQLVLHLSPPPMRSDLVGRTASGQWWVARSTGSNFTNQYWGAWSNTVWNDALTGDFNGDGKLDVVGRTESGQWWVGVSNGNSFSNQLWGSWAVANWQDVRVADFNGDGRADIAGRLGGQWWVALSTGSSFVNQYWGAWANTTWNNVMVGDFDGDGRSDVAGRLANGDWWVARSTGANFTNQYFGRWANVNWNDLTVGDFDGDGADDIAGRLDNGQVWVGLSRGAKFVNQLWVTWSSTLTWATVVRGDFNGDGRDDLAARCTCGNWYVSISTGESFHNSVWGTWSQVTWLDVRVGDFNGDGADDIAGRLENGQWWVAVSTKTRFTNQYWGAWTSTAGWTSVNAGSFAGTVSSGGSTSRPTSSAGGGSGSTNQSAAAPVAASVASAYSSHRHAQPAIAHANARAFTGARLAAVRYSLLDLYFAES